MARDQNIEERTESILYAMGVRNSGDVAKAMVEHFAEEYKPMRRELDDLKAFVRGAARNALKVVEGS